MNANPQRHPESSGFGGFAGLGDRLRFHDRKSVAVPGTGRSLPARRSGERSMAANPVESSAPEDDPCGMTTHAASGGCRSPTPPGYREIAVDAAGIGVRRVSNLIVQIRAAVASIAAADAVPVKSLRTSKSGTRCGPAGAASGLISVSWARTMPIRRRRVRSRPKKCPRTTGCVCIGVAQDGIPQHRFTRDSCHYRA